MAITGWAWRTPLGASVSTVIDRLLAGERAARPCYQPGPDGAPTRLAATLPPPPRANPHRRFLGPLAQHAVAVAVEAAANSGVLPGPRLGLFAAVGGLRVCWEDTLPAFARQDAGGGEAWERGLSRLHPFWLLLHLSNNAHALASVQLGAHGEGATYAGANAGAQALLAAQRAFDEGVIDAAVVMACDSLVGPECLVDLEPRGRLSHAALEALAAPYSVDAAGFVPGEAAAAMVLEPAARAGVRARALVAAAEAADGAVEEASWETWARLAARLSPAPVVDGLGLADVRLDHEERHLLASRLGDDACLSCLAASMGQVGAATPLVQAIALTESLQRGLVLPIAGLAAPAPGPLRPLATVEQTRARAALGLSGGAPGLAGIVRVELP